MKIIVGGFVFYQNFVLFVKHKKLGIWIHPAGHLEADESFDQGLKREINEETGLTISIISAIKNDLTDSKIASLAIPFSIHMKNNEIRLDYVCVSEEKEVSINSKELLDFKWIEIHQIEQAQLHPTLLSLAKKAIEIYKNYT